MTTSPDPAWDGPPTVVLHVWRVARRDAPHALSLMARQRREVGKLPFGKLLGTGSGRTFAVRDTDLRQYAILTSWPDQQSASRFDHGPLVAQWTTIATSRRRIELRPITSRGTWSGRYPFGTADPPHEPVTGPVAAITHARIRLRRTAAFWRAVPAVAADLATHDHTSYRLAFGEAPIGVQGTFSIWDSEAGMTEFARGVAHREVIRRRAAEGWYAEEIFARFAVVSDESTG